MKKKINVHLDFETYCDIDIGKVGAYEYTKHASFRPLCCAYSIDGGPPELWLPGDIAPPFLSDDYATHLHSWNILFEFWVIESIGWCTSNIVSWLDTSHQAAYANLPRSLGACGEALGLPQDKRKDSVGRQLIRKCCTPKAEATQEDYIQLYDYCKQDVIAEQTIAKLLPELPLKEKQLADLDRKINHRGVAVNRKLAKLGARLAQQRADELNRELCELTDGGVKKASEVAKLKDWMASQNIEVDDLTKPTLDQLERNFDFVPAKVKRAIAIRQEVGKAAVKKFKTLLDVSTYDARARGSLKFYGASTGRWAGAGIQPQNFPRPLYDQDEVLEVLAQDESLETLSLLFDSPMDALASVPRACLQASLGCRLFVADYASIEARVLAWVTRHQGKLEAFEQGRDMYKVAASQIFKADYDSIDKEQRFVGKVAELALGYQGGKKAFSKMALGYGVDIPEERAEKIKNQWRAANKPIVNFWSQLELAVREGIEDPTLTAPIQVGSSPLLVTVSHKTGRLFILLPSKRSLIYNNVRLEPADNWAGSKIVYDGVNSVNKKFGPIDLYGGKICENVTQAIARDILAEAMLRLEAKGWRIVLSVHDEIICDEYASSNRTIQEMVDIMCELPTWAEGMPVEAEGYTSVNYKK